METVDTALVQEQVETADATTAEEIQPTETPAEGEVTTEEQPAPQPKKGIERRFSELTARAKAAEQYAAYLERQMEANRNPRPQQQPAPTNTKPTREQFDYDEDRYLEALADYKLGERLERERVEREARQRDIQAQQRGQEFTEKVNRANAQGAMKYADYDDVVMGNPELVITPAMADAMTDTDIAADMAYYLGKHPQESARIAQLNPLRQAMEIARLESKLKAPAPKKTTSAPPPIEAVGARGQVDIDPEKLSTKEWVRLRNEGKI